MTQIDRIDTLSSDSSPWLDPGFEFVLVEPSHPGNIGSAARAIAVMGFSRLSVVDPRNLDFVSHPKARALASGAIGVLTSVKVFETLQQALADKTLVIAISAAGREFTAPPINPTQAARLAWAQSHASNESSAEAHFNTDKTAFVFGTERSGLTIEQAQLCQHLCSIDSNPKYGSLNLAQAVQVIAYALRQTYLSASQTVPSPNLPPLEGFRGFATQDQIESMMLHLQQALTHTGYLDPQVPKRLMPRLRRLFNRARLEQEEVDIIRGFCKSVQKMGNQS
jgi:tRNA/rRNA methyltransferase